MIATTTCEVPQELDYRVNDGLEVALLWFASTNRVVVCVVDEKRGDRFELSADRASALDVFHHPFAYAAATGIEYRTAFREPEPAEAVCV